MLDAPPPLRDGRLLLVDAARQTLRNGMLVLGMRPLERSSSTHHVAIGHAPHRESDGAGSRPQLPVVGEELVDPAVASVMDGERTGQVNGVQRADDRRA